MSAHKRPGRARVGCSGWTYAEWKGEFYPDGVRVKDRLRYYASQFDTVEINGSFYRTPGPTAAPAWDEQTPEDFVFAWKVSRFITHIKRLKDVEEPLDFAYSRVRQLGPKLGPALLQLPPSMRIDLKRLADFLPLLPKDHRHTIEFRHDSWYTPKVFELLGEHDVALCISDHHHAPAPWEVTASFAYVRGHGPGGRYKGRYPAEELKRWAERIAGWRHSGRDVYAYFDNDIGVAAPPDARALVGLLAES
jgi:uncharacterized protein YecE (DUF72 family)